MYWFYAFQELFSVFPHVVKYFQCFLQRQILEKYVGHLFSANNVSRIPKQILGAAKLCQVPDNFWHFGDKKLPLFSHLELYWGSSKLFQVPDNFWHIRDKKVPFTPIDTPSLWSTLLWLICSRTQNINYLLTYLYFQKM